MAAAGRVLADALDSGGEQDPSRRQHRGARRGRRALHPRARRRAHLQGLPRLSRLDLRLAQRDGGARHPRALPARRGDILSIDIGVTLDGWVADAARTFPSATSAPSPRTCCAPPRAALMPACSSASRATAWATCPTPSSGSPRARGFGRALAGRATASGASMHEDPQVPNYGRPRQGPAARRGHGARDRADDDCRARPRCAWPATAGRSSPRTTRRPRTSSSPSRSPPPVRASSRPGICEGAGERAASRPAQAPAHPASERAAVSAGEVATIHCPARSARSVRVKANSTTR